MKHLNKAIEIGPDYANSWDSLGETYELKGDLEKALECYTKAVELDPSIELHTENKERVEDELKKKN